MDDDVIIKSIEHSQTSGFLRGCEFMEIQERLQVTTQLWFFLHVTWVADDASVVENPPRFKIKIKMQLQWQVLIFVLYSKRSQIAF